MTRQIHKCARSSLILIAVVLLAGCFTEQRLKMYAGPDLPPAKTALVVGQFIKPTHSLDDFFTPDRKKDTVILISLRAVDDMPVPKCFLPCQTEATVAPGIHTVTFDFYVSMDHPDDPDQLMRYTATSEVPLAVTFSAEGGQQYEIRIAYAADQERLPWYGGNRLWVSSVVDRQTDTSVPLLRPAEARQ